MLNRRQFLFTGSLSVAAGALSPAFPQAKTARPSADVSTWSAVRRQFDLKPDLIHLGLFYIASHPRPVREAIESYRRRLDADPLETVERAMFQAPETNIPLKVCTTIAGYIGGSADDIALTQNTTTGLALAYHGLPLKSGDEVLTTTHDHYSHHEAIRLATERAGASWRKIPLFDSYAAISTEGMIERLRAAIRPNTRVVGLTWVHSSSGVKLPIRELARAIKAIDERIVIVVDGVHGLGVEDPQIATLGCDVFAAGTHKWIFGPRGTGFVWARPQVWATMRPIIPTFSSFALFEAWMNDKPPAQPARADWFTPGGFQAFEHWWALPAAFEFHRRIGPSRVTTRIHDLNSQMKEGLAKMSHVTLYTPRSSELSAGMVCFDVKGMTQNEVVKRLHDRHKILATTTPYAVSYPRVAFGLQNTTEEVEKTLAAVRGLA